MAKGDSDRQNSLQAGPGHVRAVPRGPEDREGLCQCWGRGEVPRPTPGRARDISTTVTCGPDASQRPQRRFSKWGSWAGESAGSFSEMHVLRPLKIARGTGHLLTKFSGRVTI